MLEIELVMAKKESLKVGQLLSVLVTIAVFLLSLYFSLRSFTGYVVNQTIDANGNWTSLIFFLIGLALTYFLIWRRK